MIASPLSASCSRRTTRLRLVRRDRQRRGRGRVVRHTRADLSGRDAVRRVAGAGAARGLDAEGLGSPRGGGQAPRRTTAGTSPPRMPSRLPSSGPAVDRPVLQRDGGHRTARAGRTDDPGLLPRERLDHCCRCRGSRLRRGPVTVQHGRPVHLVVHVRRRGTQEHLHALPRRGHGPAPACSPSSAPAQPWASC